MQAPTRSLQSRPHGAPAYYLARPATWWITTQHRQPHQHSTRRAAADPARPAPDGLAAAS